MLQFNVRLKYILTEVKREKFAKNKANTPKESLSLLVLKV